MRVRRPTGPATITQHRRDLSGNLQPGWPPRGVRAALGEADLKVSRAEDPRRSPLVAISQAEVGRG
jgi:hypothetical protein